MKDLFLNGDKIIVRSLLKKLPFKQRKAIILRFWYSQSISDVACALRITWDETDKILTNGLLMLKRECMTQPTFSRSLVSLKATSEHLMNLADLFKGNVNKKGRVRKIHSVGQVYYEEVSGFGEIHLDREKAVYILEPNPDINMTHDYTIYLEDLENKIKDSVGIGYLLHSPNVGLINLKWDSGISDIYVDLSLNKTQESMEVA